MIDFDQLEEEFEKAKEDKADLFDFYHKYWRTLVNFAQRASARLESINDMGRDAKAEERD